MLLEWFLQLLALGSDEDMESACLDDMEATSGNGVGPKVVQVVRAYYLRDRYAVVVDSNVHALLADLGAIEAWGQPRGSKKKVHFPAKGWNQNSSSSASAAGHAIQEQLRAIAAPAGLAFRLTIALNVFAKAYMAKRLPDGSTRRAVQELLHSTS